MTEGVNRGRPANRFFTHLPTLAFERYPTSSVDPGVQHTFPEYFAALRFVPVAPMVPFIIVPYPWEDCGVLEFA